MKIGEKIKRVRLHRHMKQRELGELVGFTDGAANRIAHSMNPGFAFRKRIW